MLQGGSPASPFAGMGGGPGGVPNLTSIPNLATNTTNPGQTQSTTDATNPRGTAGSPPPNPFLNPAMMQQLLGLGGPGSGAGFFGAPATPALTDTRPPEERFEAQLQVSNRPISS